MTLRTIEPAQHTAAKVAGFLYLFLMVTGVFSPQPCGCAVIANRPDSPARLIR